MDHILYGLILMGDAYVNMFMVSRDGSLPRVDREKVGTSIRGGMDVGLRELAGCAKRRSSSSRPHNA